jgi:serine/threonine protein kinase/Tfp pilus assembly protein PilF
LTPERFQQAEAIFKAACNLPDEERPSFVGQSCGTDSDLRDCVHRLLAHDVRATAAFQSPAAHAVRELADAMLDRPQPRRGIPDHIASYRVIRLLGEGGFGSVFLAEQQHPRRNVAVKVLRSAIATPSLHKRFQYEAQVLGRLHHPGIAQIYEAGTVVDTEGSEAFLAMEYVQGAPLDAFGNRLDIRSRLELFVRICDGVQYAHQKGVIHRDLKPANILVTDEGQPKILDFGVARITDPDAQAITMATSTGQIIGTLPYMSPEQVIGDPDGIDTRLDVYALGVVLYQLLSGTLPFTLGDCTILEAARRIREEPHRRLGSVVHSLRGDVETLVHKALEKDRDRRYQSAADLADDIRRFLAGKPIDARRDSFIYVLKKNLRRHWAVTSIAATVVLLLTVASVALTVLYRRAEAQTVVAEEQAARAESEAAVAQSVANFMAQTLSGAGPGVARGRDSTMLREMMDAAARRIDNGELKQAPAAELRLRRTIGDTYRQLAVYEPAERLLGSAVSMARVASSSENGDLPGALFAYGRLLEDQGRPSEAMERFQEVLELYGRMGSGDRGEMVHAQSAVASCLESLGRSLEALPIFSTALEMAQRIYEGDHSEVAAALNNVGGCMDSLGRPLEALPNYEAALAMYQRLFDGDHPSVAISLSNLGACLLSSGHPADALPRFEEALEMRRRLFADDHPDVARSLNNVASCLRTLGRPAEALPLLKESLDMWQRLLPGDHTDVAMAMSNVASSMNALGKPAEALPSYEGALAMWQRLYKADHPDVARGLNNVASCLQTLGRRDEALQHFEASLEMNRRLFGENHPHVARVLDNVAGCLYALGRPADALPRYEAALSVRKRLLPPGHLEIHISEAGLGIVLAELNRPQEAEVLLEASCTALISRPDAPAKHRRRALTSLVALYEALHAAEPEKGYGEKAAKWRSHLLEAK